MYVIGLTGGIASGKSSIAKMMSAEGAGIIDCDKVLTTDSYQTFVLVYVVSLAMMHIFLKLKLIQK